MKVKLIMILLICSAAYSAPEKSITWDLVEGAWGYHLEIKDGAGNIFINIEITDNFYSVVNLEPGSYSFRVATINILKQTGESTPWIDFIIEKRFIPQLKSVSQRQLLSSYDNRNIIIAGNDLKPGARLFLRGNGREIEITDLKIKSDNEAEFSFKPDVALKGIYDLAIVNRGDAESVLKGAIEIVEPEKAEIIFYIGAGYTVNVPLGAWSDYYNFSYAGAEIFCQMSGRNFGLENILFEVEIEAVRYINIDSLKKSTFSYITPGLGAGYYYPILSNKLELFTKFNTGLVYTYLTMDDNPAERSVTSIDLFAMAGVGVRAYLDESLFVDSSCSWRTVFYIGEALYDIRLSFACGLKL